MATITVTAKMDGGYHPDHGEIVKGRQYTMDESQWGDQLFNRPTPHWRAPWERKHHVPAAGPKERGGR